MSAPLFVTRDYRARHHRSRCAAPSEECCWIRWLPLKPRLSLGSVLKGMSSGAGGGVDSVGVCRPTASASPIHVFPSPPVRPRGPKPSKNNTYLDNCERMSRGDLGLHAPSCVKIRGVVSNQLLADLRLDYFVIVAIRSCWQSLILFRGFKKWKNLSTKQKFYKNGLFHLRFWTLHYSS